MCKFRKLVFLLTFCSLFIWTLPCSAKDKDEAINKALDQTQESQKDKELKDAKTMEEEVRSFKRFELAYESIWLEGKQFANGSAQVLGSTLGLKFKFPFKVRMDEYKMAFRLTPRIYLEGSYGSGNIHKKDQPWIEISQSLSLLAYFNTGGDILKRWKAGMGFNLFTQKKTGMALDIIGGYANYKAELIATEPSGGFINILNKYQGPYFGLVFKGPFAIPELPDNPFIFSISAIYSPIMDFKLKASSGAAGISVPISIDGKASYMDMRAGLAFQINKYLQIETAYNYLRFDLNNAESFSTSILGLPATGSIQKDKLIAHGPSISLKGSF